MNCPWGQKAFNGYLQGGVAEAAEQYDATELIKKRTDPVRILIDYVCCFCCRCPWLTTTCRERPTIFISRGSCSLRISSRRPARLGIMRAKCRSEARRATTIATFL
jgi:hypothetical protein